MASGQSRSTSVSPPDASPSSTPIFWGAPLKCWGADTASMRRSCHPSPRGPFALCGIGTGHQPRAMKASAVSSGVIGHSLEVWHATPRAVFSIAAAASIGPRNVPRDFPSRSHASTPLAVFMRKPMQMVPEITGTIVVVIGPVTASPPFRCERNLVIHESLSAADQPWRCR
jgi:hypothetical protein